MRTSVLLAAFAAWWPCAQGVWEVEHVEKRLVLDVTFETSKGAPLKMGPLLRIAVSFRIDHTSSRVSRRLRHHIVSAYAECPTHARDRSRCPDDPWAMTDSLVPMHGSAYAVRGWNTTEGNMRMIVPSAVAKHGGHFGLELRIEKAYTKKFHAQFSLPHFMPRTQHAAYQLTYWTKQVSAETMIPEVSILDVDEGYDWVGGAEVMLSE